MDFAFLPPEINSARMYSGPGSGSLLTAAGSWDSVSAELGTTSESYESVLSSLTSWQWFGPASQAMAATAAQYVGWLQTTAEQARQTAMQARAAAAAYEQAYAMTVPPPAVTANRSELTSLIATNLLGQNTAAIAANEAQYAEYWAQDATAMSGYSASSGAATQLPRFSSPKNSTNEAGLTAQNAAVTQANASATASQPGFAGAVGGADRVVAAAAPDPASLIPEDLAVLDIIQATGQSLNSTYYMEAFASGVVGAEDNLGVLPKAAAATAPIAPIAPALGAAPPACRWRGSGQHHRNPFPGRFDRADVRAGELGCTVEQPGRSFGTRWLYHASGNRRGSGIRLSGLPRDASGEPFASLRRRCSAPVRRPAHGDATPAGGRVRNRSRELR